jgi:hypothetical protein
MHAISERPVGAGTEFQSKSYIDAAAKEPTTLLSRGGYLMTYHLVRVNAPSVYVHNGRRGQRICE